MWRSTPCLKGRVATEDDVKAGIAVFTVRPGNKGDPKPANMELPRCAIQMTEKEGPVPVVIIQAEILAGQTFLGVRYLNGGDGVCMLDEAELLPEPDERFQNNVT